jgi:hypothetical protein
MKNFSTPNETALTVHHGARTHCTATSLGGSQKAISFGISGGNNTISRGARSYK